MPTWTRDALSPERRRLSGVCWRLVEAQHHVPTMKLVDTLEEQRVLESIIDETKPPVPPECRGLHYLLSTPFRYGAPYPTGSRFRRAGLTPGVFYASKAPATAVTEIAYHRLLFFADSPATPWQSRAGEYTAFAARYGTADGIDLTVQPFVAERAVWTHPVDYAATQAFAEAARDAGVQAVRYPSARDPQGVNLALFTCSAFASRAPLERRTWRIRIDANGVRAMCDDPDVRIALGRDAFAADPRIAALRWDR